MSAVEDVTHSLLEYYIKTLKKHLRKFSFSDNMQNKTYETA